MVRQLLMVGVAALLAAFIGFLVGSRTCGGGAPIATDRYCAEIISEVRALSRLIVENRASPATAPISASPHVPPTAEPDRVLVRDSELIDELRRAIDRVSEIARSMVSSPNATVLEAIRIAKLQRPTPDTEAIKQLRSSLLPGDEIARGVKREWLLVGMDEVIRRLGPPSNILVTLSGANNQVWEYSSPDGGTLAIRFSAGFVVAIDV